MCGCPYGWAPPTCRVAAAPKPVCDPLNASQTPPSCTYCDPRQPQDSQGCYNGGTCYYESRIAGVPPPGLPVCGCHYGHAAPQCFRSSTRARLCDPTNASDAPPKCEFCYLDAPVGNNGCTNQGFCNLNPVTSNGAPPNFEITLCTCQPGFVPPQCYVDTYEYFKRSDLIVYRWCFFAGEAVITALAILVIAQHLYYGRLYKFTPANKIKAFGALIVFMSALMGMLYFGVNVSGWVTGYPTAYSVIQQNLFVFSLVEFIFVAIAINTSNWIWIGLGAVSPSRRANTGWPISSKIVSWTTAIVLTTLNIFFACFQVVNPRYRSVFFYVASGFGILWCLFSCISGAVIMLTIKSIESSDPRLLFRTASQLVLLCTVELIASVLLVVVIALPASIYTDGMTLFGVSFIFTALVLYLLQVALLIQFRIAVWQLKEVALPRPASITSGESSARRKANSYSDSMSKEPYTTSADNAESPNSSDPHLETKSAQIVVGVVEL